MKTVYCAVFRFIILLITVTSIPFALRAQGLELNSKNSFAIGEESSFPFEFRKGMVFVPVRLNGSKPLSFVLDTCCVYAIKIQQLFAAAPEPPWESRFLINGRS